MASRVGLSGKKPSMTLARQDSDVMMGRPSQGSLPSPWKRAKGKVALVSKWQPYSNARENAMTPVRASAPKGKTNPFSFAITDDIRRPPRVGKKKVRDDLTVNWQKVFGRYDPTKNYGHYKRVYEAKLLAAPQDKERLRRAWRAMKHDITQSKAGLDAKLRAFNSQGAGRARLQARLAQKQAYKEKLKVAASNLNRQRLQMNHRKRMAEIDKKAGRSRENLRDKFRRGELDTGRVALPGYVSRSGLKVSVAAFYDAMNTILIKGGVARRSVTRVVQEQLISRFPRLVTAYLSQKKPKALTGYYTAATTAAAGVVGAMVLPIVPTALVTIATAWAAARVGGAVQADPQKYADKLVKFVPGRVAYATVKGSVFWITAAVQSVGMAASAATHVVQIPLRALGLGADVAEQYAGMYAKLAVAVDRSSVAQAFLWIVVKFFEDLAYYYIGAKINVKAVPGIIKKHAATVSDVVQGKDVSLKKLLVDLVDVLRNEDLVLLQNKMVKYVAPSGIAAQKQRGMRREERVARRQVRRDSGRPAGPSAQRKKRLPGDAMTPSTRKKGPSGY